MAQPNSSIQGSAYFFMPLIDALMSCRLVLSLRDADNTLFNSNVHIKSLWAGVNYESEDTDQVPSNGSKQGCPPFTRHEVFALAEVPRNDGHGLPIK